LANAEGVIERAKERLPKGDRRISEMKPRLRADQLRCIVKRILEDGDSGHKRKNAYETRSPIYFESGQLFAAT
jgi:hypothetical protein